MTPLFQSRIILGVLGLGFAAMNVHAAGSYPASAAAMPLAYSAILAAMSLAMVASVAVPGLRPATSDTGPMDKVGALRALALAVAIPVYILLLGPLGYLAATALFVVGLGLGFRVASPLYVLVGASIVGVTVWLLFVEFLRLPMPLFPNF